MKSIEEALAQPSGSVEQEPAFYIVEMELEALRRDGRRAMVLYTKPITNGIEVPVYTTPPQPKQEPVAWGNLANWCLDSDRVLITDKDEAAKYHRDVYDLTPLYTTPPQPKQEPVAVIRSVVHAGEGGVRVSWLRGFPQIGDRLYTIPPQRTWVGLTKEEIDYLVQSTPYEDDHLLVEKTEALLKEKNT